MRPCVAFAIFMVVIAATVWKVEVVRDLTFAMKRESGLSTLAGQWLGDVRQNSARSLAVAYADGNTMLDFFTGPMKETTAKTTETQKAFLALVQDAETQKRADAPDSGHGRAQFPGVDRRLQVGRRRGFRTRQIFSDAHDRFLIIDDTELYHIGASMKDLGKKWFAFSRMDIELGRMFQILKNKPI